MAMVLQANHMTSSNSSTVPMDSYQQLQHSTNQEDSFHRKIYEKIEEGKRDKDPQKCRQILDDLMKLLKHLTADVNNYNLAFRETRPSFYMQVRKCSSEKILHKNKSIFLPCFFKEFQRLTDRIDTLTKARDELTEYLHELEGQSTETPVPDSSSLNDASSISSQFQQQLQYSPTMSQPIRSSPPERSHHRHTSSTSSIYSGINHIFLYNSSTTMQSYLS